MPATSSASRSSWAWDEAKSELRVALGSHAIPSFRVCLSSRPLIRVPNDFVRSAPSSERSRSPARSPQTVRTKTRAGGACLVRVEPNKARCRFHGRSLAEVNLRLTPLMCAILLRDDFTQVRQRDWESLGPRRAPRDSRCQNLDNLFGNLQRHGLDPVFAIPVKESLAAAGLSFCCLVKTSVDGVFRSRGQSGWAWGAYCTIRLIDFCAGSQRS